MRMAARPRRHERASSASAIAAQIPMAMVGQSGAAIFGRLSIESGPSALITIVPVGRVWVRRSTL